MHLLLLTVPVNQVDGEEERLWEQFESEMDLNNPVDQNSPHFLIDVVLLTHVVGRRKVFVLGLK